MPVHTGKERKKKNIKRGAGGRITKTSGNKGRKKKGPTFT